MKKIILKEYKRLAKLNTPELEIYLTLKKIDGSFRLKDFNKIRKPSSN